MENFLTRKNIVTAKEKSAQDQQDEIFRKMSAGKKINLASDLSMFCLKLNHLNGRNKSTNAVGQSRQHP